MSIHEVKGQEIREMSKALVLEFMREKPSCSPGSEGMKLSHIFRGCGFDWGKHKNATSSNQQYWLVALMRELEYEGKVERIIESGPWRLL